MSDSLADEAVRCEVLSVNRLTLDKAFTPWAVRWAIG